MTLDMQIVNNFVNENILQFHDAKLRSMENLDLRTILRKKNPYLFKAKNINSANELVTALLDAHLSSAEEKCFGDFLENLAIFIASKTYNGRKSAARGVDLEFERDKVHYIVSIKSGPSWGNSAQQKKLEEDLRTAVAIVGQSGLHINAKAVLGICYGKTRTSFVRGYLKVVGQNFWALISGSENFYTRIVEPVGYKARENNEVFLSKKNALINCMTADLVNEFCNDGFIDWDRLVKFNSGNYDLNNFGLNN